MENRGWLARSWLRLKSKCTHGWDSHEIFTCHIVPHWKVNRKDWGQENSISFWMKLVPSLYLCFWIKLVPSLYLRPTVLPVEARILSNSSEYLHNSLPRILHPLNLSTSMCLSRSYNNPKRWVIAPRSHESSRLFPQHCWHHHQKGDPLHDQILPRSSSWYPSRLLNGCIQPPISSPDRQSVFIHCHLSQDSSTSSY